MAAPLGRISFLFHRRFKLSYIYLTPPHKQNVTQGQLSIIRERKVRFIRFSGGITTKIYNALLRNHIEPEIEKILRKNQNGFWRNQSRTSQILTIRRILQGVRAKNLKATRPLTPYREGRWSKYYSPMAYWKKPSQL